MIQEEAKYYKYQYCFHCEDTTKEEITDKNVLNILSEHINFGFYDTNKELHTRKVVALCENCAKKLNIDAKKFEKYRLNTEIELGNMYQKDVELLVKLYKNNVSAKTIKNKMKDVEDCYEITRKLQELVVELYNKENK